MKSWFPEILIASIRLKILLLNRSRFKYASEDETRSLRVTIQAEFNKTYNLYMNGGCYFDLKNNNNNNTPQTLEILGTYSIENETNNEGLIKDLNGKPAIVEIGVERGKVLLSGVHFEFDADKLELDNENITRNVYPLVKSNENSPSSRHSNETLIRYLFKRVFSFQ